MSATTTVTVTLTHDQYIARANAVSAWRETLANVYNYSQREWLESGWNQIHAAYWGDDK